ncbi:Peptidoglycan-binding domain 1 protein [Catenulispora acidiphila DSM 44928]|uniref:Peptidoglycan-binding domain 1 protein n=1 Tax=Catenulispora acidiphila (strain DSM 44928 / JCM 14897 / NBRC 102108 / NRRL B-24433 / ID139908) TaxID=479433 RepID=C7Q496_CATAD|nr:peptidoglycan-binding domain-containing protein [Catenulispora acidiphila]ACU69956.1 Peptidoglycan-binding domain 1 protein [Catenulispora acidiphila DSM 44928]
MSADVEHERAVTEVPEWTGAMAKTEQTWPGRMRRRRYIKALMGAGAVTVAAAGGVAATGVGGSSGSSGAASHNGLPPATTQVRRETLTQTESVSGTLGYGASTTLSASGNAAGGIVTWLPAAGDTITEGKPVYRVNDKPVTLLYGVLPIFRPLTVGTTGADVKEFETDLAALGYTGFTPGTSYTADTAAAVKKWQAAVGLDQTGNVDPAQAAVTSGPIRIAALHTSLGSAAGGQVLDDTGTTKLVTVALAVAKEGLVKAGDKVTVTLPDGSTTAGTVTGVGKVATVPSTGGSGGGGVSGAGGGGGSSGSGSGGSGSATIEVSVTLTDQNAGASLDEAPVDVDIQSGRAADVLVVPVSALVALAEGGYGVQVVEGTTTKYVAVKTGMFAGGDVEISGDGISEGTIVGVPDE